MDTVIEQAKSVLMAYWPLSGFIASNPLWNLRHEHFFDVVSHSRIHSLMPMHYYLKHYKKGHISDTDLIAVIKKVAPDQLKEKNVAQWIADCDDDYHSHGPLLYAETISEYQFKNPVVDIKYQLYKVLRDYFGSEQYKKTDLLNFWYAKHSSSYPDSMRQHSINDQIAYYLEMLAIPEYLHVEYLRAIYCKIYGWSSFMNWRNQRPDNPWVPGSDACESVLLMWLWYEYQIYKNSGILYPENIQCDNSTSKFLHRYIWQCALEKHYLNDLDAMLSSEFSSQCQHYDAQFVFCIDTRSEGLRRHIESQGRFETFGFAGFFGALFHLDCDGSVSYQAPALVQPDETLVANIQNNAWLRFVSGFKKVVSITKKQFSAPFALFEMMGFWFLLFMLYKNIQPKLKLSKANKKITIASSLSDQAQYQAAKNLLQSIGLTKNFAPYIVICAHQSDNVNNPFKSSLDCGACGGNSGIPNALVMCDILNHVSIRTKLHSDGIDIPKSTRFVPACHHTGDDRVEVLQGELPDSLTDAVSRACELLKKEKIQSLPGKQKLSDREHSWSELIPELGLINNACIIIGPRALTQQHNLERRSFLHSYDPRLDPNADILTTILSAPAVVAHWINSQYYFSTCNKKLFGAGNKALHNVLPGIGVIEGNLSDLKVGLPLQSTYFKSRPIHEPRRLIVVVYAYQSILDKAIEQSPDFKLLLENEWIYLHHIEVRE